MNKQLLLLALFSTSVLCFADGSIHKNCCKPGKSPCCSEACCKASDHCCKGVEPKECKTECKPAPAPKG